MMKISSLMLCAATMLVAAPVFYREVSLQDEISAREPATRAEYAVLVSEPAKVFVAGREGESICQNGLPFHS